MSQGIILPFDTKDFYNIDTFPLVHLAFSSEEKIVASTANGLAYLVVSDKVL
jgi:hypothetical protein